MVLPRTRKLLLGLAIVILVSGLFLLANATIIPRETRWSTRSFSHYGPTSGQSFVLLGGAVLSPENPPHITVGTAGASVVFVLKTSYEDFSRWVCLQIRYIHSPNCDVEFLAGSEFNVTVLNSYLQAHQAEIVYSQVIIGRNSTLDYRVAVPTNVTIVLAPVGPIMSSHYYQITWTNQTLSYPLLGWTEAAAGTPWTLTTISAGLIATGSVPLVLASSRRILFLKSRLKHVATS